MKNRRKTDRRQADLFLELTPFNGSTLPDLPADKETELKRVVGDLLLYAARGTAAGQKKADHDA
jgi:hypothetical protein